LKITLDEEKQTDKNLSEMAQSRINHISVAEVE
jgi:ferritin-like metal-binding protein YciE